MSDFPAQVNALSAAAREVRLALLDNQATIGSIDASSRTHLLEEWKALREKYRMVLDESEAAATRLGTAINAYVALQQYMDDPTLLDDLIEELNGLYKTLSSMKFTQDDDFRSLRSSFERLKQNIDLLLEARSTPADDHVSGAEDALTRSSQLGTQTGNPTQVSSTKPGPPRGAIMTASGASTVKTGIQSMPAVLELIDKSLKTQESLIRVALSDMKEKLGHEIQTYLTALRDAKGNTQPEKQLALRNATQRVTSSVGAWRERANSLIEGYAKAPK